MLKRNCTRVGRTQESRDGYQKINKQNWQQSADSAQGTQNLKELDNNQKPFKRQHILNNDQ